MHTSLGQNGEEDVIYCGMGGPPAAVEERQPTIQGQGWSEEEDTAGKALYCATYFESFKSQHPDESKETIVTVLSTRYEECQQEHKRQWVEKAMEQMAKRGAREEEARRGKCNLSNLWLFPSLPHHIYPYHTNS